MSTEPINRLNLYEELLRRFASGVRAAQLYAPDHPLLGRNVDGILGALEPLLQSHASIPLGILAEEIVVADTPMPRVSAGMRELIARLRANGVERMAFERGVTAAEIVAFMQAVAALSARAATDAPRAWNFAHIKTGRLVTEEQRPGGIASDMAAIRQLYSKAVAAAEVAWESAALEGMPDVPTALQTVEGLADAVTQNRTALVALTAMRNYDNYTFTHITAASLSMREARPC